MKNKPVQRRISAVLAAGAAVAALAVASVLTAGPATAATAPDDTHLAGLNYVSLGDSYAAGLGLGAPTGLPVPGCAQSGNNFPHLVAAQLKLDLTDASCSGAKVPDVITAPQATLASTAPVQTDSLSANTDVVTLMIGGNDIGFTSIIGACLAQSAAGPLLLSTALNCQSVYAAPTNPISQALAALPTQLAAVITAIHTKAPKAKVVVVGYPALMPDLASTPAAGCFTPALGSPPGTFLAGSFPFTNTDVPFLHGVQAMLDKAMATATTASGATYISTFAATQAHSPCAPSNERYVNGVTLAASKSGLTSLPITMHPNAAGAAFLQAQVVDAIRTAFPAPVVTPAATPTPQPTQMPAAAVTTKDDSGLAATGLDSTGWLELGALLILAGGAFVLRRKLISR